MLRCDWDDCERALRGQSTDPALVSRLSLLFGEIGASLCVLASGRRCWCCSSSH